MEINTQQTVQEPQVAVDGRFIVLGLVVPLGYQAAYTLFAMLVPETLLPPQGWVILHLLTGAFFVCGPLLATGLPLRRALRALGGRPVPLIDMALVVLIGVVGTWALSVAYNVVMSVVFHQSPDFGFSQTAKDVPLFILLVVLVGPFGEEVLFRGYFGALIKRPWVFMLVSAVVWSALHVDPYNALPLFWTGLILAWVRVRTRSFYPAFALHAAINILALVLHYTMQT